MDSVGFQVCGYWGHGFRTKSAPKAAIVAVHMDSVNHMSLSRKELREFVQDNKIQDRVVIPEDGEVMKF